jgi:SAM-dependent methyltransferase
MSQNENIDNPKSIKYFVKKYLDTIKEDLKEKVVVDFPAGSGVTTSLLKDLGAYAQPFDLFPEYFTVENLECKRADINESIPMEAGQADMVICQEGIEHFSDQLKAFKEFNRILKKQGRLIITTPSYSNLAARFSYFIFESENHKKMPPNEIDDIWMSDKSISNEIYHGHIFLVGLQKLRIIGKLSGFKIREMRYVRLSKGSLFLFPLFYPIILISSLLRYTRNLNKNKNLDHGFKKQVYGDQLRMNISIKNLLNKHTFLVFEKEVNHADVDFSSQSVSKKFADLT